MPAMTHPDDATQRALAALGHDGDGPLRIGGIPAIELLASFGSPLYVFDAEVLRARVARVRAAFGPRVQLLWSVKANPSVAVTRVLREAGAGAEIASLGELAVAGAAGHEAAALRFAGPGKSNLELAAALDAGVGTFHVESADELAALAALAAARGVTAAVAVRVNFARELAGARLRMGGRSSRFGIDEDQVASVLHAARAMSSLRLVGLHAYAGTQLFDAAAFAPHAQALASAAARWERELGIELRELDLGGGFGIATFVGDGAFDLDAAAAGVRDVLAAHDRPDRTWFVELGRYLAAPAGVYLATVVRTKSSGGQAHAVLDGGLHHHAAATGLGTVLKRAPLLVRADAPTAAGDAVTIGGPLCTPADQFADGAPLGPLRHGDAVAVLHAGAYGLSFSPHGFLSHPTPAEVLVDGGRARHVRDRGAAIDALRGQRF